MATKCPKCDSDNTSDSKFCKECGTQITPSESIPEVTKTIETPAQELTRGTVFANRYEIIEELGKGGMGEVYRVSVDFESSQTVSLSVLTENWPLN